MTELWVSIRRAATAEAQAADEEEEAEGGEELAGRSIAGPEELRFLIGS